MSYNRIGVIGSGAWGTALAIAAVRAGRTVDLWARDPALATAMEERRQNSKYLDGISLPEEITPTNELSDLTGADALLLVTPAQAARATMEQLKPLLAGPTPIILCAKGIEQGSLKLMTEVADEVLPDHPVAVLSGPSFAIEVAQGQPTAITLASEDESLARDLAAALGSQRFRPYVSTDAIGSEVGGAVKNVLAIACGIALGQGFGENTRAALISRGLAEMTRFGKKLGGRPETLMGLSGIGDLLLTCSSRQSRNFAFGVRLGEGQSVDEALGATHSVVEGAFSARSVTARARQLDIEMPISDATDAIVNEGADVKTSIEALLSRPFRDEIY